jgi:bifunctional non-homologous end joining protein LigD
MLATPGTTVPTGSQWAHEIKWDGMRVLADVREGTVRLFARSENDVTVSFPELRSLGSVADDLLLDGEVVAFRAGTPSFEALAERMHVQDGRKAARLASTTPVTYVAFDLLRLHGEDLTGRPLAERRAMLERLELAGGSVQVPPIYDDGRALAEATREQGLEGVVSKRLDSPYRPGRRSQDWLKFPHRPTISCVVGGWRPETGSMGRLGSILVGVPGQAGLLYRGRSGAGLAGRAGGRLLELLRPLETDESPFVDEVPRVDALGATWLRPELVVDLAALRVTTAGRLRQPAYRGVRSDLRPSDLATSTNTPTDSRRS